MKNNLKIGDIVQIKKECKQYSWYKTNLMKIIGYNKVLDNWFVSDEEVTSIDGYWLEECENILREQKLKRIFKWK